MPNLALSWREAAVLGAMLMALALALYASGHQRLRSVAPFAREAGVLALLYTLWQLAGTAAKDHTDGAFSRARWIVRVERDWHLPSEVDVQKLITPHPLLVQLSNLYYATMHFTALFVLLLWMFLRHRDRYAHWRTTIVLLTGACLLVQFLPVAPPRLLPEYGYVDTAAQYGQSVYVALQAVGPDQLSAMPSVHVGWAVLIAVATWTLTTSPWRWVGVLHAVLTVFVVVATANHFWLDGIVAVVLLGVALIVQSGTIRIRRRLARRRTRTSAPWPEAEPAAVSPD